ncbi:DNA/RNA polymerases superfamily protein [Gossypium australe]|uniref:DNA/RNA polymerases superfamily protein n=1 Tax=Gossypium australe TaxID=47621 RepID=A0A5B6WFN7_9ROSI|nr:DNA/RNA polymerases superfamily protein [Gossypium australe]
MLRGCVIIFRDLGEKKVLRPGLVQETENNKSYSDLKRTNFEYNVGDEVFLKVSPWKKRIGPVAYQLELPPELDRIHNVFHVSIFDPSHVIPVEDIEVHSDLTFEEELLQIIDHDVKVLGRK